MSYCYKRIKLSEMTETYCMRPPRHDGKCSPHKQPDDDSKVKAKAMAAAVAPQATSLCPHGVMMQGGKLVGYCPICIQKMPMCSMEEYQH